MSTPCLNNALQACVIASYWESSLALASELNGSLEYVAPDLVNSNLQLAALTMSHQWKHALHLLKHNFSQRGHQIDASTYNSANIGMPEPQTELVGGQRTTGEEDTATGVQEFREYLMRTFIESAWDVSGPFVFLFSLFFFACCMIFTPLCGSQCLDACTRSKQATLEGKHFSPVITCSTCTACPCQVPRWHSSLPWTTRNKSLEHFSLWLDKGNTARENRYWRKVLPRCWTSCNSTLELWQVVSTSKLGEANDQKRYWSWWLTELWTPLQGQL